MHHRTQLIAIAAAVAAIVPAAHARTLPYPPEAAGATAADWAKEVPVAVAPCRFVVPADLPGPAPSAEACRQGAAHPPYEGWIVVTDVQGLPLFVPVAYAAPNDPGARAPAAEQAHKSKQSKSSRRYTPPRVIPATL